VRWSMASPVDRRLQPSVSMTAGEQSAVLSVESLNANSGFVDLADVTAGVRSPSGDVTSADLTQTAPGRYEANIPVAEPGAYEVIVVRESEGETLTETAGFSVPPDVEFQHAGTNDRLLKEINGGRDYLTQPEEALDRTNLTGNSPDYDPLWHYFLAPGLLILLLSVAVRRIDFRMGRRRLPAQASRS